MKKNLVSSPFTNVRARGSQLCACLPMNDQAAKDAYSAVVTVLEQGRMYTLEEYGELEDDEDKNDVIKD